MPAKVKIEEKQPKYFNQITGKMRLFEKEVQKNGETFYFYSTSISRKMQDGSYINEYLNVYMKDDVREQIVNNREFHQISNGGYYEIIVEDGFITITPAKGDYPQKLSIQLLSVQK